MAVAATRLRAETRTPEAFENVPAPLRPPARRIRLALLVGFGGLLVLLVLIGVDALAVLGRLHTSGTETRQRFEQRTKLLDVIRSGIYLSGTYVRDFLLAPEADANAQRNRVQGVQRSTEIALREYEKDLTPQERASFRELRGDIQTYWLVLDRSLDWSPEQRNSRRDAFFYEELVPRRTAMLQVADRVADLNELQFDRSADAFSRDFDRFRLGSILTLSITVLCGLIVTGITGTYLLRLEREAQFRLEESGRAQADLKDLTAKLVRAQEDERRTISRELHDEVGQSLSALAMEADNLLDFEHTPEVNARLAAMRQLASRTVEEIRNMALLLRPSMLDDFGLVPALQWQARDAMRRTSLRIEVQAPEMADDLPEEHKTCIYRIVQESLNNASRHAQASAVRISVESRDGEVIVAVRDDGSGFDTASTRGLGLLGMDERVRRLGGRFTIESSPGRGTLIRACLPVTHIGPQGGKEQGNGFHSNSAG